MQFWAEYLQAKNYLGKAPWLGQHYGKKLHASFLVIYKFLDLTKPCSWSVDLEILGWVAYSLCSGGQLWLSWHKFELKTFYAAQGLKTTLQFWTGL